MVELEKDGAGLAWTPLGGRPELLAQRLAIATPAEGMPALLKVALRLSKRESASDRAVGYRLLRLAVTNENCTSEGEVAAEIASTLESMIAEADKSGATLKLLAWNTMGSLQSFDPESYGNFLGTAAKWRLDVIRRMVDSPGELPPQGLSDFMLPLKGDANELLRGITYGREHFTRDVPEDAVEHRADDPDADSVETIYTRMQEAVAKLEK